MSKKVIKRQLLPGIFVFVLAFTTFASGQSSPAELTLADKRQIIESLLKERFGDAPQKTIYISMANLSDELRKDFPPVKNKKVEFIPTEQARSSSVCAYEFGEFEENGKFVSISFGDCSEGLAYDFKKYGEKWKSVGLTIRK